MINFKKESRIKQRKLLVYLIAFISVVIIASISLYLSQDKFFPEKLGDMELKLHREGGVAVREIQNAHSAEDNVLPNEAHIALYRNSAGNRVTISVTSAGNENRAAEKVENMTRGMGGMFSIPELLEINGMKIYYTGGGGEYHYYYSKNNLVIWIAVNNPDRTYRSRLIDEAVRRIGG